MERFGTLAQPHKCPPIQPHLVSSSMPLNVSENSQPLQTFHSNTFDGIDKKAQALFFAVSWYILLLYIKFLCSTLTQCHLGKVYKCSWLKVLVVLMMKSMVLPMLVWLSNVTLVGRCQCQFLPSLCQWRLCQWHLMACRPTKQPQNGCKTIPRGNESNEVIPGTLKGMFLFEMSVEALGISLATIENCAFICWYGRYK